MKPKTRIKTVIRPHGENSYIPQIKNYFKYPWYYYIFPLLGQIALLDSIIWSDLYIKHTYEQTEFETIEEAKYKIDTLYNSIEAQKQNKLASKISGYTYTDYP